MTGWGSFIGVNMEDNDLDFIKSSLKKAFKNDKSHTLSETAPTSMVKDVIPFGIDVLDKFVCGCGGLPVGRLTELFSEEGGGKTTLSYHAISNAQKMGYVTILAETEQAVPDLARLASMGVDPDKLLFIEAPCVEDITERVEVLCDALKEKNKKALIVWDSIAATATRKEYKEGLSGKDKVAEKAGVLTKSIRVLAQKVSDSNVALLAINQTRENIGVMFGNKARTPGGSALKFYASLRLQILGGAAVKDGDLHTGKDITVMAVKNRFAPPYRKARVRLNYSDGSFDNNWILINFAKDLGIISKSAKYTEDTYNTCIEKLNEIDWKVENLKKE
jgi:recombination protein RecA